MTGKSEVRALSGRAVGELTLEAVRRGDLGLPDLRIHPETLEGRRQLRPRTPIRSWRISCSAPPSSSRLLD